MDLFAKAKEWRDVWTKNDNKKALQVQSIVKHNRHALSAETRLEGSKFLSLCHLFLILLFFSFFFFLLFSSPLFFYSSSLLSTSFFFFHHHARRCSYP